MNETATETAAAPVEITADTLPALLITFEQRTCGRCGGTGEYSYNPLDGSRCFKCRGARTVLTAAGRRAKDAVEAKRDELMGTPVETLASGDRVFYDRKWRTVEDVTLHGRPMSWAVVNGEKVARGNGVTVGFARVGTVLTEGDRLARYDKAAMVELFRYAATVKGATVGPKPAPAQS